MQEEWSTQKYYIYLCLTALFMGPMVIGIIAGAKLAQLGPFMFDGGLLLYGFCYLTTDIVSEIYGKKYAVRIAQIGFLTLLTSLLAIKLAIALPASPSWEIEQEFNAVMSVSNRVFIAAIVGYVFSQFADLTVFAWLRKKTKGRHFWLRNNVSTMCAGILEAPIFTAIAFYGLYPIGPIIATALMVRVTLSLLDTPIVYTIIWTIRLSNKSIRKTKNKAR